MDDPVAVKEVHPGEDLPHDVLDPLGSEAGWRTLLNVEVEVLVDMLEHEVENHLPVQALTVTDVQQPGMSLVRRAESDKTKSVRVDIIPNNTLGLQSFRGRDFKL